MNFIISRLATVRQTSLRALAASALLVPLFANANTITITDFNWGSPILTTDLSGRAFTTPYSALLNATLSTATLPVGIHSVLLLDPGGHNVSDFLSLDVSARAHGMQRVSLMFESDSGPGFAAAVAALRELPGTRTTLETAGLRDLSALIDSGPLSIRVDSESRAVPDAGRTLLLLGMGLLGICAFRTQAFR